MDAPKKIWIPPWEARGAMVKDRDNQIEYIRADLVDGLVEALEMCVKHLDADGNLWSKEEQAMALAALKAMEENND